MKKITWAEVTQERKLGAGHIGVSTEKKPSNGKMIIIYPMDIDNNFLFEEGEVGSKVYKDMLSTLYWGKSRDERLPG